LGQHTPDERSPAPDELPAGQLFDGWNGGPAHAMQMICRRMLRHIEMQDAATLMRQHNEYEQQPQLQRGNCKESMETN